jgi:hypothetical protein
MTRIVTSVRRPKQVQIDEKSELLMAAGVRRDLGCVEIGLPQFAQRIVISALQNRAVTHCRPSGQSAA